MPWPSLALILGAGLLLPTARWTERVVAEDLGHRYAMDLRLILIDQLSRRPRSIGAEHGSDGARRFLAGGMMPVRQWISRGVLRLLATATSMGAVAVFTLFWLSTAQAFGVAAILLCGLALMHGLARGMQTVHGRSRRNRMNARAFLDERLPYVVWLRISGRLRKEWRPLRARLERVARADVARQRRAASLKIVPDVARALALGWVITAGYGQGLAVADIAAGIALVGLLVPGMRDLAGIWDRHAAWTVTVTRIRRWFPGRRAGPLPGRGPRRPRVWRDAGRNTLMRLDAVCAGPISNLSARLGEGEKVCVVGPGGSGKSTLLKVIAGTVQPGGGRVRLSARGRSVRRGGVLQIDREAPLLGGSLRRALTTGCRRRPDDAEILRVAAEVGLMPTFDRLGGLDGRIRTGGRNLSDAERRRILLACAMLSSASLVVIDALDATGDDELREVLDRWAVRSEATVVLAVPDGRSPLEGSSVWRLPVDCSTGAPCGA